MVGVAEVEVVESLLPEVALELVSELEPQPASANVMVMTAASKNANFFIFLSPFSFNNFWYKHYYTQMVVEIKKEMQKYSCIFNFYTLRACFTKENIFFCLI